MRKPLLILTPVLCIFMISACSKSNKNNDSQGLVGTWNLIGITATINIYASEGQGVIMSGYPTFVTKNNTGSMTFAKDSMRASGIGYSVDTSFVAYFYYGGSIYDSSMQALNYTVPPTSSTSKYTLIGSDSIYMPSGGILTALDSSSKGQRCMYVLAGDSLTLNVGGVDVSTGYDQPYSGKIYLKRSK
jgi:hypothetical protein